MRRREGKKEENGNRKMDVLRITQQDHDQPSHKKAESRGKTTEQACINIGVQPYALTTGL